LVRDLWRLSGIHWSTLRVLEGCLLGGMIRGRSPVDEFNHRIKINSKSRSDMIELIEPTKTGDGSDGPNKIDWHRT